MVNTGSELTQAANPGPQRASADRINTQRLTSQTFVDRVESYDVLSSTQDRAREAAEDPQVELPLLVVADRQTSGRGRGDHRWWTGEGSLAFSLLFDPVQYGVDRTLWPRLALVVAVGVVDALQPLLGQPVGLHWPNDIYVGTKKLAGILIEVLSSGRHVLGIGLNSNNLPQEAPPELHDKVASLHSLTGREHDHTALLVAMLSHIEQKLAQFATRPDQFGERFNTLCLQRDEMLTVNAGQERSSGRCLGIGPDGALLLETAAGRRSFTFGSVHSTIAT